MLDRFEHLLAAAAAVSASAPELQLPAPVIQPAGANQFPERDIFGVARAADPARPMHSLDRDAVLKPARTARRVKLHRRLVATRL